MWIVFVPKWIAFVPMWIVFIPMRIDVILPRTYLTSLLRAAISHCLLLRMSEDIIIQISNRLREIRKDKKVTLQELAETAGVSKGLLSQIENSRTIPSLTVLLSLIKGLKIDLNDFFREIDVLAEEKVIFRKAQQYQPFEKENAAGFHYQRIFSTTTLEYHIDFVLLTLDTHATRPMVTTDAYEFKFVLQGTVAYHIGDKTYLMEEGDSLYFDATEPHNPVNMGTDKAVLLVVYFFKQK